MVASAPTPPTSITNALGTSIILSLPFVRLSLSQGEWTEADASATV